MIYSSTLHPFICIGLLVLAVNSFAIKRQQQQQQLQNIQNPINVMGQTQGQDSMGPMGMQGFIGQSEVVQNQNQNSVNNMAGFGGQQQQQPLAGLAGNAEALVNLLQQLLIQQQIVNAGQATQPNFGNQPWAVQQSPSQQFLLPSPTDQTNPLLSLLGAAIPQPPNPMAPPPPPPQPSPPNTNFGNGPLVAPPPMGANFGFGMAPPSQNVSSGQQGTFGVNPPQVFQQYSSMDNASNTNAPSQMGNMVNGK